MIGMPRATDRTGRASCELCGARLGTPPPSSEPANAKAKRQTATTIAAAAPMSQRRRLRPNEGGGPAVAVTWATLQPIGANRRELRRHQEFVALRISPPGQCFAQIRRRALDSAER